MKSDGFISPTMITRHPDPSANIYGRAMEKGWMGLKLPGEALWNYECQVARKSSQIP
jgi:hypothetical protein